jgi:AcrR family transcriptional regulator
MAKRVGKGSAYSTSSDGEGLAASGRARGCGPLMGVARTPAAKAQPARRGRPRRLELDEVIRAALAVGLHQLTMAAVANRLGVGPAVLYGYVGSRDELVQLATAHAAQRNRFPVDEGQPWSMWILEYARALFEVLTMEGQLLESWLVGGQSPVVEVDAAETWLQVLTSRGFTGEAALQLRRAVSHLVVGAAASLKHSRALEAKGQARPLSAKQAVLSRPPEETRLLRQFADVFAREMNEHNWEFSLFLLLKGAASERDALELRDGDSRDLFSEKAAPT